MGGADHAVAKAHGGGSGPASCCFVHEPLLLVTHHLHLPVMPFGEQGRGGRAISAPNALGMHG